MRFVAACVAVLAAAAVIGFEHNHPISRPATSPLLAPVPGGDTTGSDTMPAPGTTGAIEPLAPQRRGASHGQRRSSAAAIPPARHLAIPHGCQPPGPDPRCTPGAHNRAVTQKTIRATICVVGYSSSIRPPENATEPLKYALMGAYGEAGQSARGFELDHLIPLELGGAPLDTRNLFPEPWPDARAKDGEENRLHAEVCAGTVSLRAAQREMRTWGR